MFIWKACSEKDEHQTWMNIMKTLYQKKKEKDEHGWGFLEHGISKDWRNRKGWTWFDLLIHNLFSHPTLPCLFNNFRIEKEEKDEHGLIWLVQTSYISSLSIKKKTALNNFDVFFRFPFLNRFSLFNFVDNSVSNFYLFFSFEN